MYKKSYQLFTEMTNIGIGVIVELSYTEFRYVNILGDMLGCCKIL